MLLAIDIGNTNISCAIFRSNVIIKKFNIPTKNYCLKKLRKNLGRLKLDDALICSVVPKVCRILEKELRQLLQRTPYILGKNITVPIRNLYRNPKQVGYDRLVNAYAAVRLYGAPLIVVDFGTAVTFDVISKNKAYLGGMILPGLQISLDALGERAALLPKIKISKPREFIGQDTQSSMLSGIVYGFAALVDGLVGRLKEKMGKNTQVIGTGGNIELMAKYCSCFHRIDKNLTLKGLKFILESHDFIRADI